MTQLVLFGSRKQVNTASFEGELPCFLAFIKLQNLRMAKMEAQKFISATVHPIWKQPFLTSQISLVVAVQLIFLWHLSHKIGPCECFALWQSCGSLMFEPKPRMTSWAFFSRHFCSLRNFY
jgi:hypothetical protein